ncbi:MAG: hypothetical protein ACK559_13225, partial [bacterium]
MACRGGVRVRTGVAWGPLRAGGPDRRGLNPRSGNAASRGAARLALAAAGPRSPRAATTIRPCPPEAGGGCLGSPPASQDRRDGTG